MRRTTIVLDDDLFRKLKQEAAKSGDSLREYLNNLLRRSLSPRKTKLFKLNWRTERGLNPPRVPLDDRDRLYDFMDENK